MQEKQRLSVYCLLSGGIDSRVALHICQKEFKEKADITGVFLSMRGQNKSMIRAATRQARSAGVPLVVLSLSSDSSSQEVPLRNQSMATLVAQYGLQSSRQVIVCMAIHRAGQSYDMQTWYDCSQAFVSAVNTALHPQGVSVYAPIVRWQTRDVLDYVKDNGIDISDCISCDEAKEGHCGKCKKCQELAYELKIADIRNHPLSAVPSKQYFHIEELRLYINNLCSNHCSICFYDALKDTPEYMSKETISMVASLARDWDIRSIMISGREPLYNVKYFKAVVEKLREQGKSKILLNTNSQNILKIEPNWAFANLDKIYYSLNDKQIPPNVLRHLRSLQDASVPVVVYFVPRETFSTGEYLRHGLNALKTEGLLNIYLRESVYSKDDQLYPSWLKILETNGFCVEGPRVHRACERNIRNLTVLTDGRIAGCPQDTYKGNLLTIGKINKISLTALRNMSEGQSAKVCPMMARMIRNRAIWGGGQQ
jgi:7-cyano-7-deazaguanine synthase in queuosine biosynthesis